MKHPSFGLLLCTAMTLLTSIANSQCPSCDVALEGDTRDYYRTELKSDFTSLLTQIFEHDFSYYESGEWTKNTEFQSGGTYGVISGFLNGSQSSEEKRAKFETMKTFFLQTQNIRKQDYQLVSQSLQSPTIYNNWVECIKACPSFDSPILTQTVSGKDLTVTLYWQHNNTNDKQIIRDITFGNVDSVKGGSIYVNQMVKGRNSYSKKFRILDIHEQSYVTVTISEYPTAKIIIPAVPVENLASNYPVGTIISSVLDWKRFCKINGQPETLNYSDKAHCKWAPADGRPVVGSIYGEVENLVPDLRGVFLRGVNDFGVPGVPNVKPSQAELDKDGNILNRPANDFESDEFKSHNHSISGPATVGNIINANNNFFNEPVGRQSAIQTNNAGGLETRPKNVTVYYYIKIN